jgi:hypothetical protein
MDMHLRSPYMLARAWALPLATSEHQNTGVWTQAGTAERRGGSGGGARGCVQVGTGDISMATEILG